MTYVRTFEVVLLFRHAVLKSDGVDACLEQVKAGFAWHYKKYQHEQSPEDQRLYAEAENKARDERPRVVAREQSYTTVGTSTTL